MYWRFSSLSSLKLALTVLEAKNFVIFMSFNGFIGWELHFPLALTVWIKSKDLHPSHPTFVSEGCFVLAPPLTFSIEWSSFSLSWRRSLTFSYSIPQSGTQSDRWMFEHLISPFWVGDFIFNSVHLFSGQGIPSSDGDSLCTWWVPEGTKQLVTITDEAMKSHLGLMGTFVSWVHFRSNEA